MRSSKMGFIWFAAFNAHLYSLYTTFIPVFYVTFGIFYFHGTYVYYSLLLSFVFLFTHKLISISSNQIIKLSSANFWRCTVFLWTFGLIFFSTSARRSVVLREYWNILKLIQNVFFMFNFLLNCCNAVVINLKTYSNLSSLKCSKNSFKFSSI